MTAKFTGLPNLPIASGGTNQALNLAVSALLDNVGLLIGSRGNGEQKAIVRSDITVSPPPRLNLVALSARGRGRTISGVGVAEYTDYANLVADVDKCRQDLVNIRDTLVSLISQLRS